MVKKPQPSKTPQPALVPLHGVQDKKSRSLDRDAVIVGRARGCDIGLDAPDISNLHCVISRIGDGYSIRDCNSRAGTRINGNNIRSSALHDGDVLQIGPFSFTVQIPGSKAGAIQAIDPIRAEHWQRSRRHVVQQALRLRKKLVTLLEEGVSQTPTELTRKVADLRERLHTYEHRSTELEQAERELADENNKLRLEREEHLVHVQKIEGDLARRFAEVDEQVHQKWQEFQKRCRHEEERVADAVRSLPRQDAGRVQEGADREALINQVRQLSQERDQASAELKNQREYFEQQAAQFNEDNDKTAAELRAQKEQFEFQIEQLRRRPTEDRAKVQQEREMLILEQEAMKGQMEREEAEMARRLDEAEAEIQKRWQEFHDCRKQEEERLASECRTVPSQELSRLLASGELDEQKQQLADQERKFNVDQAQLNSARAQLEEDLVKLQAQRQEITTMQAQLNGRHLPSTDEHESLKAGLANVEASLDEQRQSLAIMMNDLEKIQQSLLDRQDAVLKTLEEENGHLRSRVRDLEKTPAIPASATAPANNDLAALEEENAYLLKRVQELETLLSSPAPEGSPGHSGNDPSESVLLQQLLKSDESANELTESRAELEKAQAELDRLNQLVSDQDKQINSLKKKGPAPVVARTLCESDLENYEAELTQERKRLEVDRLKLSTEIEQLRERNKELDEAVREMEMEMSRERADLARERTRLDRMREEVRLEMERMQREGPVRDSLVSVQKLREEMNRNKQPSSASDRLKGFRKPD